MSIYTYFIKLVGYSVDATTSVEAHILDGLLEWVSAG